MHDGSMASLSPSVIRYSLMMMVDCLPHQVPVLVDEAVRNRRTTDAGQNMASEARRYRYCSYGDTHSVTSKKGGPRKLTGTGVVLFLRVRAAEREGAQTSCCGNPATWHPAAPSPSRQIPQN